jgi:hypothetical protein
MALSATARASTARTARTMSPLSRFVYVLVGTAAVYQAAMLPLIQRRWGVAPARA